MRRDREIDPLIVLWMCYIGFLGILTIIAAL